MQQNQITKQKLLNAQLILELEQLKETHERLESRAKQSVDKQSQFYLFQLNQQIESKNSEIQEVHEQIVTYKNKNSQLQDQILGLQSSIKKLNTQIKQLKQNLETLETQNREKDQTILGLNSTIAGLEAEIFAQKQKIV